MSSPVGGDPSPEASHDPDQPGGIEDTLHFILAIDKLKQVRRRNPLVDGERRERTAEHCWHVAMAAVCLHPYAAEEVDLNQALRLAIVHDLPEVIVGDTFVYGTRIDSRRSREEEAMRMLAGKLAGAAGRTIMTAWEEYEYESTPEGRYVMAIDVLLPIFLNLAAGPDSSWSKYRVSAEDVRKRVAHVQKVIPPLAKIAYGAIDEGVHRGLLL